MPGWLVVVGISVVLASRADAQVTAVSVKPDMVAAGGYYTIQYSFKTGAAGWAKGGGVRIEIPVAYAETEFVLWTAPQTESPDLPGYVWAVASNNVTVGVHVEGLLRGIVEADIRDDVPAGGTLSLFYRGQVQGIAGQVDARFQSRARANDPWSVGSTSRTSRCVQPARKS